MQLNPGIPKGLLLDMDLAVSDRGPVSVMVFVTLSPLVLQFPPTHICK